MLKTKCRVNSLSLELKIFEFNIVIATTINNRKKAHAGLAEGWTQYIRHSILTDCIIW